MDLRIFKILVELTEILHIRPPQCVFDERRREGEPLCELRLSGYELVFRTNEPKKLLVYQLAYSLRRLYQYLYNPSILRAYRYKGEIDREDFVNQPAEIDAHAFACCFCFSRFDAYISDECFSAETTEKLKRRCMEIWKEYDELYYAHRMLYIDEHVRAENIIKSRKEYMKTHRKRWRRLACEPSYEYLWYKPGSNKEIMDNARRKTKEEAYNYLNGSKKLGELLVETAELFDDINSIYGINHMPNHSITDPGYDYMRCFSNVRRCNHDDCYDDYL